MPVSIFNDVIGPVMRGPSSSHCAAALRIGRLARDLMGGEIHDVLVEFDRAGSLPTTHETQGSDMGLFGGLLGWDAADDRLPTATAGIREKGIVVRIETIDAGDPHPNTYRVTLTSPKRRHSLKAISTGGGSIEIIEIDGFKLSIHGDYYETLFFLKTNGAEVVQRISRLPFVSHALLYESANGQLVQVKASQFLPEEGLELFRRACAIDEICLLNPVLPVLSRKDIKLPFTSCAELLSYDDGRNFPLWKLGLEYEMARGNLTKPEVLSRMQEIVRLLYRSIQRGIAGTTYENRILGHQSGNYKKQMDCRPPVKCWRAQPHHSLCLCPYGGQKFPRPHSSRPHCWRLRCSAGRSARTGR